MPFHDFTTFPLGAVSGYVGNGLDADWIIADIPAGRRLYVPNYPSYTWLQTTSAIITSAAIEFEAPNDNSFISIAIGIHADGIDLCKFSVSESTLYCATYGNFVVTEPIPSRLRLEVEIGNSEFPTVTATLRNADTNAILGECSDSLFAPLGNSAFGMLVDGYPAGIEVSISRFEWEELSLRDSEPFEKINTITVLTGFKTQLGLKSPRLASGQAKLEDDIKRLVLRVLYAEGLLRTTLTPSDLGSLAAQIESELVDPDNWWVGQAVPVSASGFQIGIQDTGAAGVTFIARDEDSLEVIVNYSSLARSVLVDFDGIGQVVVPFEASIF